MARVDSFVDVDLVRRAVAGGQVNASGFVRAPCPLCALERAKVGSANLWYHPGWGRFGCYRCGARGRLQSDATDANTITCAGPEPRQRLRGLPDDFVSLATGEGEAEVFRGARDYLARRGVSRAVVRASGVGACARGRYAGRVVFPFLGADGALRGFVARDHTGRAPRTYLNSDTLERADALYNQRVLSGADDVVLAVEGVFDALPFYDRAVAFLGKPTDQQLDILAGSRRSVAVVLDGDAWEEGWMWAWAIRSRGGRAGAVHLPPCADPDEVDPLAMLEAADESVDAVEPIRIEGCAY